MKRVLVAGFSNRIGGTEGVIKNYVSALEGRVAFDLIVDEVPSNYAGLFEGGNRYLLVPNKRRQPFAYNRTINRLFAEHAGEYDAVWSNLNILNNVDVLRLGWKYGIPRRILHAHNSQNNGRLHQRVLCAMHKPVVQRYLTDRWACSKEAGDYFFPNHEYLTIPNAIDDRAFAFDGKARERVRAEFGVAADILLVGAVGRLVPEKNYSFLVNLWPKVIERAPGARLVILGEGELMTELSSRIDDAGLSSNVLLPGTRRDVRSCLSAFDVFAMPSLFEGLPLSLLEAQFNGLPCVLSDAISDESIISDGCARIPLEEDLWVDAITAASRDSVLISDRADTYRLSSQADLLESLFNFEG